MYLFFDTETTGLPANYKASIEDVDNWPRLVQLAWITEDKKGKTEVIEYIIKPEGFTIPKEASDIHGITTEKALKDGVPLKDVLAKFAIAIQNASYIIGHNISFDINIMGCEYFRTKFHSELMQRDILCTMQSSTSYCKLPGFRGKYKWPKLEELYLKLFDTSFENAHDAKADIMATRKCFWKLRELKLI